MKKRRHHYIWQQYLRSFCYEGDMLYCLINKCVKSINTVNVGIEKDIYRLQKLGDNEIYFLKIFFVKETTSMLSKLNKNWIKMFTLLHKIVDLKKIDQMPKKLRDEILEIECNISEDIQTSIENMGEKYLRKMIEMDLSFFQDSKSCSEFIFYIFIQYMRTKKMQDMIKNIDGKDLIDMSKIGNVITYIFATNAGSTVFVARKEWELIGLVNNNSIPFITCDQPVINLYSKYLPNEVLQNNELELYYPIKPNYAVVLKLKESQFFNYSNVDNKLVDYLNHKMLLASYQQVYSNSVDLLNVYKTEI